MLHHKMEKVNRYLNTLKISIQSLYHKLHIVKIFVGQFHGNGHQLCSEPFNYVVHKQKSEENTELKNGLQCLAEKSL